MWSLATALLFWAEQMSFFVCYARVGAAWVKKRLSGWVCEKTRERIFCTKSKSWGSSAGVTGCLLAFFSNWEKRGLVGMHVFFV